MGYPMSVRIKFVIYVFLMAISISSFVFFASNWSISSTDFIDKLLPDTIAEKEINLSLNTYVNKIKSPPTSKLAVPKDQIYLAVDIRNYEEADDFEILVRKNAAIFNNYVYWGEKNNKFDDLLATKLILENQALILTWNPSKSILNNSINQPKYRLKKILRGDYDNYLKSWTVSMKKWNRPIILRFAPEMNGDWLPWGINYTTPKEYIRTFRYVVNFFRKENVENVSWMWSPNEAVDTNLLVYYPGDEYVDWVGISGFNWGNTRYTKWRSLDQIFTKSLNQLKNINKPIAFAELGCVEDKSDSLAKAKWITDGFNSLKSKFPKVKMIVWNNSKSFRVYDWRVNTSISSLKSFRKAVSSKYFADQVRINKL